ncbi:MAG: hypothetical protein V1704_02145 [Candidatus Vogelbacteria bacterium]
MKLKLIIAILISAGLIFGAVLHAKRSEALAIIPVGGPILYSFTCCNGLLLTIGAPRAGAFLYPWGAPLYPFYNITMPGPYVLGRAIPGGMCMDPDTIYPPPCTIEIPALGTLIMVGTSGL